jgi:amino acid transporter
MRWEPVYLTGERRHPRRRPFGVTILAIAQTISGIQLLIVAFVAFAFAAIVSDAEVQEQLSSAANEIDFDSLALLFVVIGIVSLALSVFSFALARGYAKGRPWAWRRGRKIAVFTILFAILGLMLMPARTDPGAPLWTILLNIFIFLYLGRVKVKAWFR